MEVVFFFKLNPQTQRSWQAWFSRKETKTRPWSGTDRSASPSWTCTQFPSHWIWVGKYLKTIASSPVEGILIIPCRCAGVFKIFCVVSKSPEKKVYQRCLSQAETILPIRRYLAKSGDVSGYNIQGVVAGFQDSRPGWKGTKPPQQREMGPGSKQQRADEVSAQC